MNINKFNFQLAPDWIANTSLIENCPKCDNDRNNLEVDYNLYDISIIGYHIVVSCPKCGYSMTMRKNNILEDMCIWNGITAKQDFIPTSIKGKESPNLETIKIKEELTESMNILLDKWDI
jgi:predicted nucleic-acid-binding Zn-ribbon protein